jgi:hypothetical protein
MNSETDRVTVPTNGRKPRAAAKPKAATSTRKTKAATAAAEAGAAEKTPAKSTPTVKPTVKSTSPELTVAVSPAQLAVGFGVVAGIILLVLGRRSRRKG